MTTAGETGHGVRRIIPITGGTVKGEGINGKVCAFGADFQVIRPNELIELEAKYAFETDDGAVIYVENKGLRFGPVDLLQKLKRGEPVDPKLIYFRTVPKFETGQRKIPLADGKPLHRLRRPPRRPRRHRRASGVVARSSRTVRRIDPTAAPGVALAKPGQINSDLRKSCQASESKIFRFIQNTKSGLYLSPSRPDQRGVS